MYKISVPVVSRNLEELGRERTVKDLKRFDAERVFLSISTYETDTEKRKVVMETLKRNVSFLKENGFEVGSWNWTFKTPKADNFINMKTIGGKDIPDVKCPLDKNFVEFVKGYVKDIALCGVDLIMFDDDFRYGFLYDSPACLCDNHIAEINKITGENSTREELEFHIKNGGKNKYRDAYIKANGDAFRNFARELRNTVDEINPDIRIGACACMTSWDLDGVSANELAHILAGKTKPFVRLIGAPYWAVGNRWGNSLQDVIEFERMESSWTRDDEIEIFSEGDSFPRPRTNCPASYVEGFDTALRAAGCTDGILKYGIDYHSNRDYEEGYALFHERNRQLYKNIDEIFGNKKSCGVRIYEAPAKLSDLVVPTKVNSTVNPENMFFSKAARTAAFNTIPTVYDGEGICGMVFDENARHIPLSAVENGLILDLAATEILSERGIDVGIESIGEKIKDGLREHFLYNDNNISALQTAVYNIKLKESAEILSDIETSVGVLPVSYRYENADGNRFLVLNINSRDQMNSNLLRHYERSRQFADAVEWFSGKKLPAYTYGHPAMYIQCKENENSLSVGLWNFFADVAIEPVVELAENYSQIKFIQGGGVLSGDKVKLDDIPAFSFAGFELIK
ncbi:MAG: hypothetical protein IJM97_00895 [Clostridia bacterium]|nr:hypothetical protein [Clostridia bacterium]